MIVNIKYHIVTTAQKCYFSKKFFSQNICSNKFIFPKNYFHRYFSKYSIFGKILSYVVKNDILYSQLHFNIFLFMLSFNY